MSRFSAYTRLGIDDENTLKAAGRGGGNPDSTVGRSPKVPSCLSLPLVGLALVRTGVAMKSRCTCGQTHEEAVCLELWCSRTPELQVQLYALNECGQKSWLATWEEGPFDRKADLVRWLSQWMPLDSSPVRAYKRD